MALNEYKSGTGFPGVIGRTTDQSEPAWPEPFRAVEGAPNALFVVLDGGSIDLVDAAIMVKDAAGNLMISETLEVTPEKGAKRGALVGGVIGAIFPPGILGAAAIGAAVGATAGHFRKLGFTEDYLDQLNEELAVGRSALMVVVNEAGADSVRDAIDDYIRLNRQPVRPEN
jgi:uncharacterized membrane protein